MLCNVCRGGLQGIWDPTRTKRICRLDEWFADRQDDLPMESNPRIGLVIEKREVAVPRRPDGPESFIFGHHVTEASFLQSVEDGCVMNSHGQSQSEKALEGIKSHLRFDSNRTQVPEVDVNSRLLALIPQNSRTIYSDCRPYFPRLLTSISTIRLYRSPSTCPPSPGMEHPCSRL